MSEYKDFTSLPPDKERQFVVYEKRTVESSKKAMLFGIVISAVFAVVVVIVVFSFPPPENKMAHDDMGMLKRATPKDNASPSAPAVNPPADVAPTDTQPADSPAGDSQPANTTSDTPDQDPDEAQ
ncbi:MAG: hypothetical protein MJE77_03930 [Proteobacteria bacterium]|nr:hypothetical protein [Pseudomonadota bacterium]